MLNYKAISNLIGSLLILDGIFMLLGIPFSIYYNSDDILVLALCGGGTIIIGIMLYVLTRNYKNDIRKRDGYFIVSIGWIAMSLFGALPFFFHGAIPSFTDSFFETMSGFTTTGASILNNIEALPKGLLFWRSVTQWLGGMGMIVLSIAILPILGVGGMQLFVAEVPGPTKDKIHPRIKETAKRLWGIYFMFTMAETILLMVGGMTFFDAVCHSFTTMATGGFSTKQASIAYFDSPFIHYVIIFFMFLAGMNFSLHYYWLHSKFENVIKNEEFKFYLIIISGVAVFVTGGLLLIDFGSVEESFRTALFQVVSIITTTGFATSDYDIWGTFYQILFFVLLFTGGSAGSTGGGIKMVRLHLLLKNSLLEFRRLVHPRAVIPVRYNGKSVPPEIMSNVLAFFLLYVLVFVTGTLVMGMLGLDFMTSLGSVATSLGNVGPAIGEVGPSKNFAFMPDAAKWFLSLLMLMGRLELFTVLIIFSPALWKS